MSILVTLVFSIIICFLINSAFKKKNQRFYQLLKQFPSHPTYPLIGNLHLLMNPMKGLLEKVNKMMLHHDRLVFWFGPMPVLLLKKHNDIAFVMSQCRDRDMIGMMDDWTGVGIVTARYDEWKTSRKILNPAFTPQMLSKYLHVFNKNASILVENLKSVVDTGLEVDTLDWTSKVSLDSIVENTMGISNQSNEKSDQDFCKAVHVALMSIVERVNCPLLYPNLIYKLYLIITKKSKMIEQTKMLPTQILRKKLIGLENLQCQKAAVDDAHSPKTIIDLLINKSHTDPGFTETRITDELIHILATGFETTALTLSWLLLMLAINKEVQQKVYEEITQLPTSQDHIEGTLTETDLNNHLGYLEQCIKETIRMFSPGVADFRRTDKEIVLDGKTIPENLLIVPLFFLSNSDSKLYKNPSKWDPEHFSDEAIEERPKTSELSFGYGPRYCIGAKYGMMNLKTITVHILRKYHLSTSIKEITNKDLHLDISIRSKIGYPVKFSSRQGVKT